MKTGNVRLKFFPASTTKPKQAATLGVCIDWYSGETGEYITTTGDCGNYVYDGNPDPTMPGGSGDGSGSGDYGGGGGSDGGGSGGGSFTLPSSSPASVIVKASVHDDKKAECVLTKLQDNAQFKQLLKNFQNTSQYNVSFEMGSLSGKTGQSTWSTATSTSIITIDKSSFDYQHAIWGATTFFHEAYHAQLQQFAIATYGTLTISKWSKPINDMTLQELIGCAIATAPSNPS